MELQYRLATREAIDAISRQVTESYAAAYRGLMTDAYLSSLTPEHWYAILCESMDRGDVCLVAECRGEIIGSSVFGVTQTNGTRCARWHAFYLLPNFVGCGAGHSFYERIEQEMHARGCTACVLEVLSTNARALRFYHAHGYVKTDTFTVQENGMTLVCDTMEKSVSADMGT